MSGEDAQERGTWRVGRGQGTQGSTVSSWDLIFVLRKVGRNGRILSRGVASSLPFQKISLVAVQSGDGWVGGRVSAGISQESASFV